VARQVRRSGFRGRTGRSPTNWAGFTAADATVADATKQIVGSVIPLAGSSHETVVRIVGDWNVTGAGVAGPVVIGALVVTDAAFAAGAASIPGPITDLNDDVWMFISSVARGGVSVTHIERQFDSRAMRKVDEGNSLVFMIENQTGANIGFTMFVRILAKSAIRS